MKKIFALLLCSVMIFTTVVTVLADEPKITCTVSDTKVKMGETFTVTVSIDGYEPIRSGGIKLDFDQSVMEYVSGKWLISAGIASFNPEQLNGVFMFFPAEPHDINGDIFQFTLRALEDAPEAGGFDITVTPQLINENGDNAADGDLGTISVITSCVDHKYGALIPEIPAKCGITGKMAHYECSVCHKLFDESKNEITDAQLVIPALIHIADNNWTSDPNNHWKLCAYNCGAIIDNTLIAHTFEWKEDKPSTEDELGSKHEECTICGYKRNENTVIDKLEHVHVGITYHSALAATCHSEGNVEYWTCSSNKCIGKYYSDANCMAEIATVITPIDTSNHVGDTYIKDKKEATCYEEGYTGDTYCKDCDAKIATGTAIEKNAHNHASRWSNDATYHWKSCQTIGCGNIIEKAAHAGGEATCTKKAICSVCGVEYGAVNADNHKNTEIRNVVEATCTTDGCTGDTYCKDCGVKISNGVVTPARHKLDKVDAKAATHKVDGNIEYYICSVCGKLFKDASATVEIAKEDTLIAKVEHDYGDTYKTDTENHWKECGCGNIIEKASHFFGDWNVVKEATATEKGVKERVCSVCGYKAEESIPAIGTATEPKPTNPSAPGDKDQTTKPADTDRAPEKSLQTGDTSNLALWIALMFVATASVGSITVYNRKKRVK